MDYHLSQQSPCVNGQGVCRDTESPTATNDISNVFGMMKDDSQAFFSYSRPLAAINEQTDRPISITKPTFVSWAVGALDEVDMQPLFHSNVDSYPLEDVMVSFGRTAEQNC